jgi:hypothetical protein
MVSSHVLVALSDIQTGNKSVKVNDIASAI